MRKSINKSTVAVALLLASSSAFAANGIISGILTKITEWAGLGQTAALAVSGLLGLVMFIGGIMAFKGNQQSQTTKGMAAVSVIVGIVLMYAAFMIKGSASELGIDKTSSVINIEQSHQPVAHTATV